MKNFTLSLVLLLGICLNNTNAQENYSIQLNNKSFTLPENKGKLSMGCAESKRQVFNEVVHVYVQFYQIPGDQEKKALEGKGLNFLSYIPNNTYIVSINKKQLKSLQHESIRSASFISEEHKINPLLLSKELPSWALKPNSQIDLMVSYYSDLKHEEVKAALLKEKYYIVSESEGMHHFEIRIKTDAIKKTATLPYLYYIDPERAPATPENEVERTNHRSYAIDNNLTGSNGVHYDGAGVSVAVGDDGIIGPHIDYTGRANQTFVSSNNGDHGDHVCGILAGGGNLNPKTKGMAPACTLYIYTPYSNINYLPTHYSLYKIRITSLSYGQACNEGYTSDANKIDAMMISYPAAMSVFSAGNSGTSNCYYKGVSITGWGNITGGMKAGKNVIAVANVWNTDSLEPSSSRGPASDGRIKPDISAVGTNVYATVSTNSYTNNTGTSMACPAISGVLAQLYQAYRAINNAQDPEGALMKGILLNSADDIGNPGPDYKYGYGRVNALRALEAIERKNYTENNISNGDSITTSIIIPANVKKIKVMLYYADKEAASGVSKALVNDLNLTVKDFGGTEYKPWVLNPTPTSTALNSFATRNIDTLNNMEQVTIDNPTAGNATVKVKGFKVPFGPQHFYIIWQFEYDSIRLVYPLGNDHWTPGASELIRWDSWNTTSPITLQTSTDSASWTTISSTIPGKNRLNSYTPPTTTGGKLWVKIKQGTTESVTRQYINVSPIPSNLKLDWICSGSCRISWNAVANASSYNVYRLGAKYMDSVANTTNTYYVFTGIDSTKDDWFSVNALLSNNTVSGERANAVPKLKMIKLNCTSTIVANFSSSRNNVCMNDTVTFNPITTPLTGLNYYWTFQGGTPANSSLAQPVIQYAQPGTYNVILVVSNGAGGVTVTKNQYLTIIGSPVNAGADQTICEGDSITINATGGVSFVWALNKAIVGNTASIKLAPVQTSTYTVTATSAQGCFSYDSVKINVNPLPSKPLISFTAQLLSTVAGATSYQWYKNGIAISGATGNTHLPVGHGNYKVRIGNSTNCYNYSDSLFLVPAGISSTSLLKDITLYPNPNTGSFVISGVDAEATVVIYDMLGKDVTADFYRDDTGKNKIAFKTTNVAKGVYFVNVQIDGVQKTMKVVLK